MKKKKKTKLSSNNSVQSVRFIEAKEIGLRDEFEQNSHLFGYVMRMECSQDLMKRYQCEQREMDGDSEKKKGKKRREERIQSSRYYKCQNKNNIGHFCICMHDKMHVSRLSKSFVLQSTLSIFFIIQIFSFFIVFNLNNMPSTICIFDSFKHIFFVGRLCALSLA